MTMKNAVSKFLISLCFLAGICAGAYAQATNGPLPEFTYGGIALDPENLNWCPTTEIEHPGFIKVEGLIDNPLGKYYLYYGSYAKNGVGFAYSDSMRGPWIEYEGNPVVYEGARGVTGCAAPDIRWVVDDQGVGKFFLWAHSDKNNRDTDLWTSTDGIQFEYQGKSIQAATIGTKNATYTRMYNYPIEKYGSKYIMLYTGYYADTNSPDCGLLCLFMAHSTDAVDWTQLTTPIVKPGAGETSALYDPALFQWGGTNYIVYADNNAWRGGTLKYVEVNNDLDSVGSGGTRYVLMEGPAELEGRLCSPEFLIEGDTIHMISGGDSDPHRAAVYAYAKLPSMVNSSDYSNWIAAHGLAAAAADPTADPDGDGRSNMEEYAFDENPITAEDAIKRSLALVDVGGSSYYSVTVPVRDDAGFSGSPELRSSGGVVNYNIYGSSNLTDWTQGIVEVSSAQASGLPGLNSGWMYRTFRLDIPESSQSQGFIKIEALESDPTASESPTFNQPIKAETAVMGSSYSANIADWAFDWDGDPMTFSKFSGPDWLKIAANGDLSGTPTSLSDLGTNVFAVLVETADGWDTETLTLVVTDPPPAFGSALGFVSGQQLITKDMDMQVIFFLDKHAVALLTDMEHHFYQPEKEGFVTLDGGSTSNLEALSVYYMSDEARYKIWYETDSGINYAESTNGLNWVTPAGINNPVFAGARQGAVTYDPNDTNSTRRCKLSYVDVNDEAHIAYSSNGINWQVDSGNIWHPGDDPDTENNIFYSPFVEKWQVVTRSATGDRRISTVQSEDLQNWDAPSVITHPSPLDPVGMEFYGMPVYQYEDIFLGLLWKFRAATTSDSNDGPIEPELTYSYDGLTWNRTYQTFIDREQRGSTLGGRIFAESIIQNDAGGINIYSKAYADERATSSNPTEVVLHKMPKDRFAGFESTGYEGYLRTKVFVLKGDDLKLNISAPYGSVKVQITNKDGDPRPGFTFGESIEWSGDATDYSPQWNSPNNLSELIGELVRFEFKIQAGTLYSIQVPVNLGFTDPPYPKRM